MDQHAPSTLRHNFLVNIVDGGFFGLAMGFASFTTILPLFVSKMTSSALLIGLIPAIHAVGWQFPQLFTINLVARQKQYRPLVLRMTVHERLPFVGMAIIAWFVYQRNASAALVLTFMMLIWQGIGGGLAATPWQSMIAKIMPAKQRGTFFGLQASAANLLSSASAVASGAILDRVVFPLNFTLCFLLNAAAMVVSFIFIAWTREADNVPAEIAPAQGAVQVSPREILRKDSNFRWFVAVRCLSQLATMAFAFYMVYVVKHFGISNTTAGVLTSTLMICQIVANPLMGWLSDRWSHRGVMAIGLGAAVLSSGLAALATTVAWYYLIVVLAGIANVAIWTVAMAMTLEFGQESERPAYIGLSNTLVAPITFLAPLFGGWLADLTAYPVTFWVAAVAGVVTVIVTLLFLRDPKRGERVEGRGERTEESDAEN